MIAAHGFLNSPSVKLTNRVLRVSAKSQGFWAGLAGVVVILVISGPFTTADVMSTSERAIYWSVIATVCYFCAIGCAAPTYALLLPHLGGWKVNSLISGLV
ncbi:MAG: hypothetical protein AB8B85_10825, partial [Paracoccaceae bacterium]